MFRSNILLSACTFAILAALPRPSAAQALSSCKAVSLLQSPRSEQLSESQTRLFGSPEHPVQLDCDEMQFFADYLEIDSAKDLVIGRGHVVFVSGGNRISADRMEFDTKTRTGVFYNAYGTASLGNKADRSLFGTQEPDVYFFGEELR